MKKKQFNKKFLVIISIFLVLLFLLLFVYFSFINRQEHPEKTMVCSAQIAKTKSFNLSMDVKLYYTNKINKMQGTINYEVLEDLSNQELEKMKSAFQSYYKSSINGDSVKIEVSRESNVIKIEYDIDYNKYNSTDIELFEFVKTESNNKEQTIEDMIESIEKMGGTCVEE